MSTSVVVDTDVISYLFKSHPTAFQYLPDIADRTPMISFMTLAELDRWVHEAHWGEARSQRLHEYLERFVAAIRSGSMHQVGRGDGRGAGMRPAD